MAYQAIYRRWRPTVFDDVVGQSHITKTLENQIIQGTVSHAYLFCGTRGTGKTTCAKILAKAVNCLSPKNGSPCNECAVCRGIDDGSIMDVFELDAASNNGVDNVREIIEDAKYVPTEAKYRVYIIDEVHMLSGGAFNALLKTLEEPPAHVLFILATTEPHKIPETILSRSQRHDFKRIRPDDIIRRMREIAMGDSLSISDDAYRILADLADGSMRDGLSILERCVASAGTSLTYQSVIDTLGISGNEPLFNMTDAINQGDSHGILKIIDTLMSDGKDLHIFMDNIITHLRNLLVCKVTTEPDSLLDADAETIVHLKAQADAISYEKLSNAITVLSAAKVEAKWVKEPRVIYELALIKLTKPELSDSYSAILDRLSALEDKVKNGIKVEVSKAPQNEEKKAEPKKAEKPSGRLYVPIDKASLTPQTPVVAAARKWDKTAQQLARRVPHVAAAVISRKITIDGEGIILIFNKNEMMLKSIAATNARSIAEAVTESCGSPINVKTAFFEDIEDNIIDFWNIRGAEQEASVSTNSIDALSANFPEIVEMADESEFLEYSPTEDNFSQTEFDDEQEEFLDENELENEE